MNVIVMYSYILDDLWEVGSFQAAKTIWKRGVHGLELE